VNRRISLCFASVILVSKTLRHGYGYGGKLFPEGETPSPPEKSVALKIANGVFL
jgi:hypothetical protein